jgi:xylan 1,4-beta-xylosidase
MKKSILASSCPPACHPPGQGVKKILRDSTFTNPILAGDYPDPSIVVGDDFYMTHTSGRLTRIAHWKSRDLVHWTPVTRALKVTCSGDIWAPT